MTTIIAETALSVSPNGDAGMWNPANYSWMGREYFLLLVVFGTLALFVWRFGGRVATRLEKFLESQQELNQANSANIAKQLSVCQAVHSRGGPANVNDLRGAGHAAANALQTIADHLPNDCGREVKPHTERLHELLRSDRRDDDA